MLNIYDDAVTIQTTLDSGVLGANLMFKDKKLTSIVAYEGHGMLVLARLDGSARISKHLWRQIHAGKLSIYDDRHTAPTDGKDADKALLALVYDGQTRVLSGLQNKKRLVSCINKAYGLQLDYKAYTWPQLFSYINTLDR